MFNLNIGSYYPASSIIHRLNPLTKFLSLLILVILMLINHELWLLITISLLILIMIFLSKIPLILYLRVLNSLKTLIVFIIIINLIVKVSFMVSFIMILKVIISVLYSMMIIYTTTFKDIIYGLEKLFNPLSKLKFPVKQLSLSLSLAFKFIPLIFIQAEKIIKAQASRGIDFKYGRFKHKALALSSMLLPMFILSLRRADDIADALEVKLFDLNKKTLIKKKWLLIDYLIFIIFLLLLMITLFFIILKVLK